MLPAFETVAQAIAEVGKYYPENDFVFQDLKGEEKSFPFPILQEATAARAAALQQAGMKKGDRVGLIVIEPEDFVLTFLACLRVGVIPVPLYPPRSFGNLDAYAERTRKVLASAEARLLIASSKLQNVLWALVDQVPSMEKLIKAETLRDSEGVPTYPTVEPDDIAFLQYTSGSTADPKGVMVTHRSLVANAKGIITEGLQMDVDNGDKGVSWLPLYHDMGLIGFVLAPVLHAIPIVFIPTLRFIKRPSVWLDTMHRHRGTASFAPNFAFALATRRVRESDLERWDLSCVKVLGCGAEPIQPDTVRAFTELYGERCDMPATAIMPAYGMAEATLAIALKRRPDLMRSLVLDADRFSEQGEAVAPTSDDTTIVEHMSCGRAVDGHEVVAMDVDGSKLPDRREGELCLRGPSVTPGYFRNPEATASAYRDGWLHTGDLGFVDQGEIFVTGRIKDLIIVNGRNIHPQAVEWAGADGEGVRKGNVIAFSVPGATGEELVIVVESRWDETAELAEAVTKRVQGELSIKAHDVVVLKPGSLPKTSSGKLQRRKARSGYLSGSLGETGSRQAGARAARVTLAKHVARSVWSRAKATLNPLN